jgi:cyclin B
MPGKCDYATSTQPELGGLGYRSKAGLRPTGGNGLRSMRASAAENVKPGGTLGSKRSPRLGGLSQPLANNNRSFSGAASLRQHSGSTTFGTDITNIAGKNDMLKKQLSSQPANPTASTPPPAGESAVVERQEQPKSGLQEPTNVQDVEEYVTDILNRLFLEEAACLPRKDYMDTLADLTPKMRTILIDWLVEVHMKYKLRPETLHLAVNLIDRYLSRATVMRKKLQLVGVVAMFIAAKFEEINPPELHDWVYITDKAYTKDDVLAMECTMLTALNFQISVPTAAHFLPGLTTANGCNAVHSELAQYIVELALLDIRMIQYPPSHTVAAALLLSNELMGRSPPWTPSMLQHSRHSETALRPCVDLLRQLFEGDRALTPGAQLQAVHKKFSSKERHSVATMRL